MAIVIILPIRNSLSVSFPFLPKKYIWFLNCNAGAIPKKKRKNR